MLNYAIIDDYQFEINPIPPENFRFVDPSEINVRTKKPIWTWVARACHEIPIGKCVLLPVPDDMDIQKFMVNLRAALIQSNETKYDKFSIRRSKHEDYAVIMKSGVWKTTYQKMEEEAEKIL